MNLRKAALYVGLMTHRTLARLGILVIPKHYYVPYADIGELERTRRSWARPSSLLGIDLRLPAQEDYLRKTVGRFKDEYEHNQLFEDATNRYFGPGYGYLEAQALYGFVRATNPAKIIEVGSGASTYCMLKAIEANETEGRCATSLTCVEPYPSAYLKTANVRLIEERVERLDPSMFDELGDGDFLFIDSSHSVRVGGDVVHLYTEVLPRLRQGVRIHIHDIYFPYLFNSNVLNSFWQWSESALLAALLANNGRLRVLFCMSYLHYHAPAVLKAVFPQYVPLAQPDGLQPVASAAGGGGRTFRAPSTSR